MLTVFVSSVSLLRNAFEAAPFLQERLAAARIALSHRIQRLDPISAEMPVAFAQFAPCDDHADAVEERQRKRPDDPSGRGLVAVGIDDLEFSLGPDGGANGRQFGVARCDRLAGAD